MRRLLIVLTSLFFSSVVQAQDCYVLRWSDEFNGTELDRSKWNVDIGNGYPGLTGWGNSEVQYYSDRPENVQVSNGSLKITARNDGFGGYNYSSGRIRTKGQFDFKHGRIEARIKIPSGQGLWPAFWLLPTYETFGTWPRSGEIDIMENFGQNNFMTSAIHYQNNNNQHQYNELSYGVNRDEYHIFAAVWENNNINFFIDWNWIGSQSPTTVNGNWPFNEDFFLILNLALGGSAGNVSTTFPKTMEVDYVRVYQKANEIAIEGPSLLFANQVATYSLPQNATATYSWAAPAGGEILSGQGTNEVIVKWGSSVGNITCAVANWRGDIEGNQSNCGNGQYSKNVAVEIGNCDIAWLDFDKVSKVNPDRSNGVGGIETMYELNPGKNAVNNSDFVGRFGRAGNVLYDVLKLNFTESINALSLRQGVNTFKMDVYATSAGTIPITVEFVNRAGNNAYPTGIHSQYTANVTQANTWQTLTFSYVNTPDWSVDSEDVDGINIFFNPNTNTATTYYFDNLRTTLPLNGKIEGPLVIEEPSVNNTVEYTAPAMIGASYDWSVGSRATVVDGQTDQTVEVYFDNDFYTNTLEVELTNTMSCKYTYDIDVEVKGLLSVNEQLLNDQIEIYPNPVAERLYIKTKNSNPMSYKLLNAVGVVIEEGTVNDQILLDTQHLENGMYILSLQQNEQYGTVKIVKK